MDNKIDKNTISADFVLNNGYQAVSNISKIYLKSNIVFLDIVFTKQPSASGPIGQLPDGFKPISGGYFNGIGFTPQSDIRPFRIDITETGLIGIYTGSINNIKEYFIKICFVNK